MTLYDFIKLNNSYAFYTIKFSNNEYKDFSDVEYKDIPNDFKNYSVTSWTYDAKEHFKGVEFERYTIHVKRN